jgi:hypothetical protein
MALIDQNGRLFGRINIIDSVFTLAVVLGVAGVFLVQSGVHVTSGQVVQGETDIAITVFIPLFKTLDSELFKPGEKTSITIRNQPRGDVLIEGVEKTPVKMTAIFQNGQTQIVDDLAQVNSMDYTLRLRDHAKITKDGYVAEGVKVKVGLPMELEGFKYRVYGKIVNVEPIEQRTADAGAGRS